MKVDDAKLKGLRYKLILCQPVAGQKVFHNISLNFRPEEEEENIMEKIRRNINSLLLSILVLALVSFGSTAFAGGDTYKNFKALSAKEKAGVDYRITSKDTESSVAVIAIHGGSIEKGTTEVASKLAGLGSYDFYTFEGIKKKNNSILHITSTKFDESTARTLVSKSKQTISVHGCVGDDKVTYLGGLDTELGEKIKKNLEAAGFVVKKAPSNLAGVEKNNIANANLSGKGVQLELTRGLRDSFFSKNGMSDSFNKYVEALKAAIE